MRRQTPLRRPKAAKNRLRPARGLQSSRKQQPFMPVRSSSGGFRLRPSAGPEPNSIEARSHDHPFGRYFGLPDASPFVIKAMLLFKFAGLPFHKDESSLKVNRVHDYIAAVQNRKGFARAPKGKLPYIDDDGTIVGDSTFIRLHIEKKYGFDFDTGLGPEQKACAWAVERRASLLGAGGRALGH
jgi:hypothetical protein